MEISEIKYLLKLYDLTPNKLRGQNFLLNENILKKICEQAKLNKNDLVLEIGPGLGALTKYLSEQAKKVICFEIDKNFQAPLAKLQAVCNNVEIIWQDILTLDDRNWSARLKEQGFSQYKVVANIPYYLTGKIISKFCSLSLAPQSITLLIQKEVAQRLVDSKKNSLLSLAVAFYGQASMGALVSKDFFYPAPQVDSAIVHITNLKPWAHAVSEQKVWQLVKRGFSNKRKKLINNLASDPQLDKIKLNAVFGKLGLNLDIRAEKLSHQQWLDLAKSL